MFNPSRDEVRMFFCETWKKHGQNLILTPLESMALDIILAHAEYHDILGNPEKNMGRNYFPEEGKTNPFLHMSLHLAIAEQLSIDQPRGIQEKYRKLLEKTGASHEALHLVMDCLGEMLWQAQRKNSSPDPEIYFSCLDRQAL